MGRFDFLIMFVVFVVDVSIARRLPDDLREFQTAKDPYQRYAVAIWWAIAGAGTLWGASILARWWNFMTSNSG